MAKLQEVLGAPFNADDVEPAQSFDLLPAGIYAVEITESEIVDTKRGDGKLLKLTLDVIDPAAFAGRKLWARLNLRNPSAEAERIGQAQLSQLCRAVGKPQLADEDDLIGCLVRCKVTIRKGTGEYSDQNEVKGFEAHGTPAPVATAVQVPKPAAPAKPWQKRAA